MWTVWQRIGFAVLSMEDVSIEKGYNITLWSVMCDWTQDRTRIPQAHCCNVICFLNLTVASFHMFKLPFHNLQLYVLHVIPSNTSVGEKHLTFTHKQIVCFLYFWYVPISKWETINAIRCPPPQTHTKSKAMRQWEWCFRLTLGVSLFVFRLRSQPSH